MANLQFEIKGEPGSISITTYKDYVVNTFGILREFDAAISGKRMGSLGWYVNDLRINEGLVLGVQSRIRPAIAKKTFADVSNTVVNTFVSGWKDIEERGVTPPYLSEYGLTKADHIAQLIGKNGAKGFRISSDQETVNITPAASTNLREMLPRENRTAIGAIEGTLEEISIHKQAKFIVYHSVTKRAVNCIFDQIEMFDDVKEALGKRVNVRGLLIKNSKGDTLRVQKVERFRVLGESGPLLPVTEVPWPDPDFVDAEHSDELLRRIRGG